MNNENVVKIKNNKGVVILIIILILLVVGMGTFIVYDKVLNNNKVEEKENKKMKNNEESKEKSLTLSDVEINSYLQKVPTILESGKIDQNDAYTGDTQTLESIDKEVLYGNVYKNTSPTNERPTNDSRYSNSNETVNGITLLGCVKADDFKSNLKNMYNIENEIESFEYPAGNVYKLNDYYCNTSGQGTMEAQKIGKAQKYYLEDNALIIEEKAGFAIESLPNALLSKTSKEKDKIEEIDNTMGDALVTAKNKILDNIDDYNTFKHTFKKNSNGDYYWYSTELK